MARSVMFKEPKNNVHMNRFLVNAFMVIAASVLTIIYNYHILLVKDAGYITMGLLYAVKYIPTILVAALGGAVPGMICVLIVFSFRTFISSSFSYLTFIYLLVVCVVDVLSRRKWFAKRSKIIPCTIFLQILVGNIWGLIMLLLDGNGVEIFSVGQCFFVFMNEFPGCFAGCLATYLLFKHIPDEKKLLLGNGKYYVNPMILDEEDRHVVEGRSKIGLVVMNVIVIEALVLGFSAELASNTLIPSMEKELSVGHFDHIDAKKALASAKSAEAMELIVSKTLMRDVEEEQSFFFEAISSGLGFINIKFSIRLAMLIAIIVIPLAVFMNRYAQRRIAEPIRQLSRAVSKIYTANDASIHENIDAIHSLDINTKDEIEELYHSVDLTFYRLVEYIELVKNRQAIEAQLESEKTANEAKSRFLSNISHEIRTPINAVLGFDEMILRETDDPEILSYARDIQNSGKTLLALINDVLDFSKIEAGKLELIPVEYDLASLMNDVLNMSNLRARDKQLTLDTKVNENIPHVLFGDEIRIKQCIINLMTNAIKYTEKGVVSLTVDFNEIEPEDPETEDAHQIMMTVKVADTGIGIKDDDIERLTVAFERIDEKKNRTIEGTGLGINIVNMLLDLMGSKLEVKSEYGVGSEFSFSVVQDVVDWEPIGDFEARFKENIDEPEYRENFRAPDARILAVDDTRTNLTVIEGLLKKTKIRIDTAASGMEALELVKKNKYNIIFLDHRMPEMDGIQTFHAMEEMEDNLNKETPVVALTANAISGSREMYFREGFANYMSKPVDPGKLEEMILSYLPREIVAKPGDPGYEVSEDNHDDEKAAMQALLKLNGVDVNAAIERCGSASVARDVMKDFRLAINEKADLIEKYLKEVDVKNYTILVHGLKSSARAIGALELSEKAAHLEACGNDGDISEINDLSPDLLETYREYYTKLEPLISDEESDKPVISKEELESAYASIKEFVTASYFDSADDIMKMLEDYKVPKSEKHKYHEIKRLMAAVDRDGLLNIL
ncbi:MAG: response regulator [Butyrivibrio sp.]|nr:response regulator [Butyrivibrio sp.]